MLVVWSCGWQVMPPSRQVLARSVPRYGRVVHLQLGRHVVESTTDPSVQGMQVMAMSNGARIISSNQVRTTRRTIDTVSELLERPKTVAAL